MESKKISIVNIKDTRSPLLTAVRNTYENSFPEVERRDFPLLMEILSSNERFHVLALMLQDDQYVGFLTYWDFDSFIYAEHFAIEAEKRCGGIGGHCLSRFLEHVAKPVVLEVEMPTNDFSRRRIGFYERLGFTLDSHYYTQPPYHDGGESLELQLMTYNYPLTDELFESVKRILYREVYKVKD